MTHTQAHAGRGASAVLLCFKKKIACSWHSSRSPGRNRAGHGPHCSGRWEVRGSFLPQPPSAQKPDNLDPGHEPSILFIGLGGGGPPRGPFWLPSRPWRSLPLAGVEQPAGMERGLWEVHASASLSLTSSPTRWKSSEARREEQMWQIPARRGLCQPRIGFPVHPVA